MLLIDQIAEARISVAATPRGRSEPRPRAFGTAATAPGGGSSFTAESLAGRSVPPELAGKIG